MIFKFKASCGEQSIPIEVKIDYRPGKQTQRARRVAVGDLLATLESDKASIDASGEDQIRVLIGDEIWVIT